MNVTMNGEPWAVDASDCANLAELVAAAEAIATEGEVSVVVGISVDGRELAPDVLGALESERLDGVKEVSIERRPARHVVHSVLRQGAEYSDQVRQAIEQTVDYYRGGRSDQGAALLADVTDSLTILTGITMSVSGVIQDEAKALGELQAEITPWLEEMIHAQTEEDPIRIADTLEYEVGPRIEGWGRAMSTLADSLDSVTSSSLST